LRAHRELEQIDPGTLRASTVTVDTSAEEASVSPDGQMVVFFDRPDGSLWRSSTDGSQRMRLTNAPLEGMFPRWSPKGEQILFSGSRPGQTRQIYIVSWDGGALRPVLPNGWVALSADWAPDGYRIVVSMRNQKTHPQYALYTLEPTTAVLKQLPHSEDLVEPRWSPDGRHIVALDNARHRLLRYDVHNEQWTETATGGLLHAPTWSADGASIYFQDQTDNQEAVLRMDVGSGRVKRVMEFRSILQGSAMQCLFSGVGDDGSIYVMIDRSMTDIYALDLDLP
jgi:Tol biopolymer transport system component